jgi:SAM-dependent methyltransferase
MIENLKDIARLMIRWKDVRGIASREEAQWFFNDDIKIQKYILDICGAYGLWGFHYRKKNKQMKYVCLDINKKLIDFGKHYSWFFHLKNASFIEHNIHNPFPFPDETFNDVWLFNWWEEIFDRVKLFNEIKRVLKNDGRFLFNIPKSPHVWSQLDTTEEQLKKLLSDTGFECCDLKVFRQWKAKYEFYFWAVKARKIQKI